MSVNYPTALMRCAAAAESVDYRAAHDAGGTLMKVHHLNCGTMRPLGVPDPLVCHVLVIETNGGLVLVDSGFGTNDCARPDGLGRIRRRLIRPAFDHAETLAAQLPLLGFRSSDVRHIIVTHFDADHIGGLADFPDATVHVTAREAFSAMRSRSIQSRIRFQPSQWAHGPKLVEHEAEGESWRGFAAAKQLSEIGPGFALVPLPGHTDGHTCVAVDAGDRWLLHAGDAFFHLSEVGDGPPMPKSLAAFEMAVAADRKKVRDNHARLTELYRRREPDLMILCSHDPTLYQRAKATG